MGDAPSCPLSSLCGSPSIKYSFTLFQPPWNACFCALQDDFLGQSLIDDIAHALGTGLRRKGQAALLDVLDLAHDIQGKGVDAQGRQGDIDTLILKFIDQEIHDALADALIIAGA